MSTDLLTAAQTAVTLFNSGPANPDYSALIAVMANNVTIKRVRASESKSSIASVTNYLNNYMHKRSPSFTADTPEVWSLQLGNSQDELFGYASTSGTYSDDNDLPLPQRFLGKINLTLCFTRKLPTDDWILVNSWSAVK